MEKNLGTNFNPRPEGGGARRRKVRAWRRENLQRGGTRKRFFGRRSGLREGDPMQALRAQGRAGLRVEGRGKKGRGWWEEGGRGEKGKGGRV